MPPTTATRAAAARRDRNAEARLAREAGDRLASLLAAGREGRPPVRVRLSRADGRSEDVELPAAAARALAEFLSLAAAGRGAAVVPVDEMLTTGRAADLLDVSRPHLVSLLDGGAIPHRRVGTHRRVRLADLLAYREANDAERREALAELAAEAQELGLGY